MNTLHTPLASALAAAAPCRHAFLGSSESTEKEALASENGRYTGKKLQ
jgi:hypothetical protein